MTQRWFRSLAHPVSDPDEAQRARLIATATAATALYMASVAAVYMVGGHRTSMLIALSVAALAALAHAVARTGRLPATELATAALAAYGAFAVIVLQGPHSGRLGVLHLVVVFLGLATRLWMVAAQVAVQIAVLAIVSIAGVAIPLTPPSTPVWIDVVLQLLLTTVLMTIFTHGYQRQLAALLQRTARLEAAHGEIVAASARLERLVSERTIELERAGRDLETFASTISHDLQAPLRHVRQYLALFLDDAAALGDERLAPVLAAQRSAVELTTKIEAILEDHRRASSGRLASRAMPGGGTG
jgi:signal transduction histidine kinase